MTSKSPWLAVQAETSKFAKVLFSWFLLLDGRTKQESGHLLTLPPKNNERNVGFNVREQNQQGAQVAGGTFYGPKLSIREAPDNGLPPSSG